MKRTLILGSILTVLAAMVAVPAATVAAPGGSAFDRIKPLAGEWDGIRFDGVLVAFKFQVHSRGSAVTMTQSPADEPAMVTVFHRDGGDLMMTHYCSVGNHSRMKASGASAANRVITFKFVDVTNLAGPADGHMIGLRITFTDDDHVTIVWTWLEDGMETDSEFNLTRSS